MASATSPPPVKLCPFAPHTPSPHPTPHTSHFLPPLHAAFTHTPPPPTPTLCPTSHHPPPHALPHAHMPAYFTVTSTHLFAFCLLPLSSSPHTLSVCTFPLLTSLFCLCHHTFLLLITHAAAFPLAEQHSLSPLPCFAFLTHLFCLWNDSSSLYLRRYSE